MVMSSLVLASHSPVNRNREKSNNRNRNERRDEKLSDFLDIYREASDQTKLENLLINYQNN